MDELFIYLEDFFFDNPDERSTVQNSGVYIYIKKVNVKITTHLKERVIKQEFHSNGP